MEDKKGKKILHNAAVILGCICINLIGKAVAGKLNLPIWLDMTGTCIAAYFVGLPGALIVGAANNLLYGIIDSWSLPYIITSLFVAALVSYCVKKGYFEELSKAAISSFGIGVLSVAVSTPINLILYKGYSGNMWGDALFDMLDWRGMPRVICAIAGEVVVEIVDKQIGVLLAFAIIHAVTRGSRQNGEKAKNLLALVLAAGMAVSALAPASAAAAVLSEAASAAENSPESVCFEVSATAAAETAAASAQSGDGYQNRNYTATVYNNTSGMMSSEANVIGETGDGYIWIGSYSGLTRYDGKEFKFIRDGGITGVNCMLTDSAGRLWIGTNDSGIARYEDGKFTFFTKNNGLPANSIRYFTEAEDGSICIGTTDKICVLDREDNLRVVEQDINYVISMVVYDGITVCVDNNGKLFALRKDGSLVPVNEELEEVFCNCVAMTSRGILLGTSGKEVYILDVSDSGMKISGKLQSTIADVISMEEDREGHVWLCAETGMGYFDKNGEFYRKTVDGFDSSFEYIHADYQGNIWVASSRYGVLKLSGNRFVDLFSETSVSASVVNAVVSYRGNFYCGTDNGMVILDMGTKTGIEDELTKMLEGVRVRSLLVDSQDRLWICTYSDYGLICCDKSGNIEIYNVENKGMTSNRARCVLETSDATIVAGTSDGINYIRDGKIIGTVTAADGLLNTQILSLVEGADGAVYAGSDGGGLYRLDNGRIAQVYRTADGLTSDVILRVVLCRGGYLLVTSNSLCYLKDGSIKPLRNFPYFNNYDIIMDGDMAYVMSSAGIYVVNVQAMCDGDELNYSLYNADEGLLAGLTANSWNYLDGDGTLYFCCNNGVMAFYANDGEDAVDYHYGVTSVVCDGEEILSAGDAFTVPADARKIVISASVRNYTMSDVKTRFYIEGIDDESPVCSYRELEPIQLTNPGSGTYRICFQIIDGSSGTVIGQKNYTLNKTRQIWENAWYKVYLAVVCVEIIAFTTWTVLIIINNSKRKEQLERLRKELEEKVSEQTEEIRMQQIQTVTALSDAVDAKDRYTSGHSKRVAAYAKMIAAKMGKNVEEQDEIYRAGLLHDVGKIRIPEVVINKPGSLTSEEFDLIKLHPVTGYHILKGISGASAISQGAKSHHERYDGTGYPNGLKGNNIPEVARIIGVADAYDAMASNRSYRQALAQDIVRNEISNGRGTQFDPEIADIMLEIIDADKEYRMKQTDELNKTILIVASEDTAKETADIITNGEPMYAVRTVSEIDSLMNINKNEKIDLILLDDGMPGMNGSDGLCTVMEAVGAPVVYMSTDKSIETIQTAAKLGVSDYITKPFLPMTIVEIVHSILNG